MAVIPWADILKTAERLGVEPCALSAGYGWAMAVVNNR